MVLQSFIVFEGLDGSGTSTQLNLLKEKYGKKNVVFTAEPTTKETGKFLRTILKGDVKVQPETVARLFAADRNEHIFGENGVLQEKQKGNIVISDRYLFSSLAYQSQECGEELPYKLNEDFPLPEYLFFFDMAPEDSLQRVMNRSAKTGENVEIYEKLDTQKKTYSQYKKWIDFYSQEQFKEMKIVLIDGNDSIENIHKKICNIIDKMPILNR